MIVTLNDVLNDYDVRYGETIRTNCPYCNGYNTFSVTNMGGSIVWNCYKASCKASGAKGVMWSIEDIELMRQEKKQEDFVLPEYIVPCNQLVGDWADSYELDAVELGLMYDVREERAVFLVRHDNKIVDATGRALTRRQPKWKRYGSSSLPYICGAGSVAVVVEDCVSAAVVGNVKGFVGVALLGTSLQQTHKQYLAQFSTVLVALDPDAIAKSATHAQALENYVSRVKILNLQQDLKYRNDRDMKLLGDMQWK